MQPSWKRTGQEITDVRAGKRSRYLDTPLITWKTWTAGSVGSRDGLHDGMRLGSPVSKGLVSSVGSQSALISSQVCFGMIFKVNCQKLPGTLPECDPAARQDWTELLLQPREGQYALASIGKIEPFAHINCKTALVLFKVHQLVNVVVAAYSRTSELINLSNAAEVHKGRRATFFIHLDLYGPRQVANIVGRMLSDHSIFLQDPLWNQTNREYANPHVIRFQGYTDDEIRLKSLSLFDKNIANLMDWTVVLDDLHKHHATMMFNDATLTTPLLRHQLDGYDYMMRRETGRLESMPRFWILDQNEEGTAVYRHVVTGAERVECPPEPLGGILADDMGLGKTLTTLALIVSSPDRAALFARGNSGVSAKSSSTRRTPATLIVAPSILILEDWSREIERRVQPGTIRVTKYHAHERAKHFEELLQYDIVLTTYGTITTEHRRSKTREVLYHLHWFRIVLDEAHVIRSQHTKQFQAVMTLSAVHHWCLSGTPIANKVDDLGALIRFCRVPLLEEKSCFREHVTNVTKRSFTYGCRVLRKTLSPLCLRRTKALLNLPKPTMIECAVKLSLTEQSLYRSILSDSKRIREAITSGMEFPDKQFTVLHAILQLRRLCNHGTFLQLRNEEAQSTLDADEIFTLLQEADQASCVECFCEVSLLNQMDDPTSGVIGICKHILCRSCIQPNSKSGIEEFHCPSCDQDVPLMATPPVASISHKLIPGDSTIQYSTKLNRLMENLKESRRTAKSLVFSVWKTTIDIASKLCTQGDVKHVVIDGSTPQPQRREAIDKFTNDPEVSVMLMTLGTGALGLNLTAASHIHLLEPQWNPSTEEQAIGRAIRIGQENRTIVFRYIVEDTVEVQIQGYQKRKIQLAVGGFGESSEAETEAQTRLLTATFLNQTN